MQRSRFWIAQQVADTKYTSNVRPLLKSLRVREQTRSSETARRIFMMHSIKNFIMAFWMPLNGRLIKTRLDFSESLNMKKNMIYLEI